MTNEPLTSLKRHPEIATKIGLVIAEYAYLELRMYIAYALFSDKVGEDCFASFYGWRSLHLREEMVTKEAETKLNSDLQKALRKLWKRFKSAANRRTEIAHCTFLAPKGAPMRLRLVGATPKFEPLDEAIFDRTFSQYRTLDTDIGIFSIFCAQTVDRLHRVLQSLPHAQLLDKPVAGLETPPDQKPLEKAVLEASLTRLGLKRLHLPDRAQLVSTQIPKQ